MSVIIFVSVWGALWLAALFYNIYDECKIHNGIMGGDIVALAFFTLIFGPFYMACLFMAYGIPAIGRWRGKVFVDAFWNKRFFIKK